MTHPYRSMKMIVASRPKRAPRWSIALAWIFGTFRKIKRRRRAREAAAWANSLIDRIMPAYPGAERAFVGQIIRSGIVIQENEDNVFVMSPDGRVHKLLLDDASYKVFVEPQTEPQWTNLWRCYR